jgi:hypothetical protein
MERTHRPSPRRAARALLTLSLLLAFTATAGAQTPTAFTYQGRLTDAGTPAGGAFDFEFKLFDGTGAQLGTAQTREDVVVTNGVFLVRLDFGASPFVPGAPASTLEIGVRPGASTGAFTTLSPRQTITATPYAVQTINAEMLGGVPAGEYVKTDDPRLTDGGPPAPGSEHYVQNATTQQPNVSFNIGGNGLFGGQVGIGTQTPSAGIKLEVNGDALITTATGNRIQFGTPNVETGMSLRKPGVGRADLRFDGSTVKLVAGVDAGPPPNASGVAVTTAGNVGVGTDAPTVGKLHVLGGPGQPAVYGETANRGVWGVSTGSSYGVYGESGAGIGVQGVSTSNIGVGGLSTSNVAVAGTSVSSIGVFGQTGSAGAESPGVKGVSTGTGGVGVKGVADVGNSTGVSGASAGGTGVHGTSSTGYGVLGGTAGPTGYGVYASNTSSGMALGVAGHATQNLNKGGLVKAMIYVRADGTVARCFNSQRQDGGAGLPPSGNTGCGFTVTQRIGEGGGNKDATVDFNFDTQDRFWSATITHPDIDNMGLLASGGLNTIRVRIFFTDARWDTDIFRDFILIVY